MSNKLPAIQGQPNAIQVPEYGRLRALLPEWEERLRFDDLTRDTRRAYRRSVERFIEWLERERPGALTPIVVRQYRDSIDGAPSTANLRLTAVRQFLGWLVEAGIAPVNPAEPVRGLRRGGTTKRHKRDELTSTEVLDVLDVCLDDTEAGIRDRAIISLMAYSGIRTVEAHRADLEDLDTRHGRRILWVHGKGRGEGDEVIVLNEEAERELSRWLAIHPSPRRGPLFVSLSPRNHGERLSRPAIRALVKRRYREAGIVGERKTTHSLRHSAISQAIRGGATPTQAQAMARHANVNTTLVYFHEQGRYSDPAEDLISYER